MQSCAGVAKCFEVAVIAVISATFGIFAKTIPKFTSFYKKKRVGLCIFYYSNLLIKIFDSSNSLLQIIYIYIEPNLSQCFYEGF